MSKKLTKSAKIRNYIAKNPNAKASEVAKALGYTPNAVYQVAYKMKKRTQSVAEKPTPPAVIDIVATHHTDMVNHPPHYTKGGIETIDFIEAKELGYNLGNVVKYITRADHKGDKHEDLCKARWYLNREIAKLSK
jgi:hypothetical protein